jgi:hypothetical protein
MNDHPKFDLCYPMPAATWCKKCVSHEISAGWLEAARGVLDHLWPSINAVTPRGLRKMLVFEGNSPAYLNPPALAAVARERGICTTGCEDEPGIFLRGKSETAIALVRSEVVRCDDRNGWAARLASYGYPELGDDDLLWQREREKLSPCPDWLVGIDGPGSAAALGLKE